MEQTDADLVRRVLDGDDAAFARLVDRHYPACTRYAARMLGGVAEAEDAVQETFIRAYRALGSYRDEGKFGAWLFRILVNRCRSHGGAAIRRRRVEAEHAVREECEEDAPAPAGGGLSPPLAEALAALPTLLREALLLKHVEDRSYEEMAELTGAGRSALKMRVKRATEMLRQSLEAYHA